MASYLVTLPTSYVARQLQDGYDSVVVNAVDAAQAKAVAKMVYGADVDVQWDNATVTDLAAATDWATPQLWNFRVKVRHPTTGDTVHNVTVKSSAGDNTIDEIAALLVTALNATAINGAAYVSATNVLTIAAVGDNIGDHYVELSAWPDGLLEQTGFSAAFFGAPTHGGIAGAALATTLAANVDGTVPPVFYSRARVAGPQ